MMPFSMSALLLSAFICLATTILGTNGQWTVTELGAHEMRNGGIVKFNSTVDFMLSRPGNLTHCSAQWVHYPTPQIPTGWHQCEFDSMLRFRIAVYNDVGNFTLEVVELDPVRSHAKTVSIGVTRANITVSTDTNIYCFGADTDGGTMCTLSGSSIPLNTTSSNFAPAPLPIVWSLSRSDGPQSGDIPCTEAWTFYIYDTNVANLGHLTLGREPLHQWETHCDTTWACTGNDTSVDNWTGCAAPAFQFKKTLPAGGNVLSNFVMSITHTFPLMMASSIRGLNASDLHLTDPEEVGGMDVTLVLEDTKWKNGSTMTPIMSGGIDQTGDCNIGCEFSGKNINVNVKDILIS